MYLDLDNSLKLWYHHNLVIQSSTGHPSRNGKPFWSLTGPSLFLPASLVLKKKWPRYINENEIYITILEHEWFFLVLTEQPSIWHVSTISLPRSRPRYPSVRLKMSEKSMFIHPNMVSLVLTQQICKNYVIPWLEDQGAFHWSMDAQKRSKCHLYPSARMICFPLGARCWYSQRGVWTN